MIIPSLGLFYDFHLFDRILIRVPDGKRDPTDPTNDIIAAINTAVFLIAKIKISGPLLNSKAIVDLLVDITTVCHIFQHSLKHFLIILANFFTVHRRRV